MDLFKPIIRNPHSFLKDGLELICIFLFVAPLKVRLCEVHCEEGRRFLVDAVIEEVDPIVTLRCYILRWIIQAQVVDHPLIIVAKTIEGLVLFVPGVEKLV